MAKIKLTDANERRIAVTYRIESNVSGLLSCNAELQSDHDKIAVAVEDQSQIELGITEASSEFISPETLRHLEIRLTCSTSAGLFGGYTTSHTTPWEGLHVVLPDAVAASLGLHVIRSLEGHSHEIKSVAFLPGGRTALSGDYYGVIKLWDIATGSVIRTFEDSGLVFSVALAPDGHTALSGGYDHTMKLWDVATGRLIRTFEGHAGSVNSVAFSPDGRTVLSGSDDKTLKLWDITTGRVIRTFDDTGEVNSVAFSPDGRSALRPATPSSCGTSRPAASSGHSKTHNWYVR